YPNYRFCIAVALTLHTGVHKSSVFSILIPSLPLYLRLSSTHTVRVSARPSAVGLFDLHFIYTYLRYLLSVTPPYASMCGFVGHKGTSTYHHCYYCCSTYLP